MKFPIKIKSKNSLFFVLFCMANMWTVVGNGSAFAGTNNSDMITSAGLHLGSIFDGLKADDSVKIRLISKTTPSASTSALALHPKPSTLQSALGIKTTLSGFSPDSCPTGGICAQPGTASAPGGFCEDAFECATDVSNQEDTENFSFGTLETYECSQCCVNWVTCPISSPPVGSKPGQPCDDDPTAPGGGGDQPDVINGCSPIIIDVTGEGFQLTSAAKGVKFDIANTGTPIQIAWTANSNNAWLVLDRDGNGVITSGAEMFGNFTAQPSSPNPNGFLALATYDDPANGGNGDGIIDSRDQIFSKLRLWIDANHDGICQPGELHTLPEMGVFALSLDYSLSGHTDQFGNAFRYSARVNPGLSGKGNDVGRKASDVFLSTH